jgi:ribonuclease III
MDIKKLEKNIGYEFKNKELLIAAITHRSYSYELNGKTGCDNEKLEFLGDTVLNFVITDLIYKRNPGYTEGELSKLRASLIKEHTLAQIAKQLDLGRFLLLGKGEELTGGREKPSLLSNAYEAVLAAIFLDSGFRAVYKTIKKHFSDSVFDVSLIQFNIDYKSQVQEESHRIFKTLPQYKLIKKSGPDHKQMFHVELTINKKPISEGTGSSKKEAEQSAAKKALGILKNAT